MIPVNMGKALLEEENVYISVDTTRNSIYLPSEFPSIEEWTMFCGNFHSAFFIKVLGSDQETLIAEMYGSIYDEQMIELANEDIVDMADAETQDDYNHIYHLAQSEDYLLEDEDFTFEKSWAGLLERLYVYPEYRGKGIAKYLLDNLPAILKYTHNINLRCICTYPQPQNPQEGWLNIDDEVMKKRMVKVIEENGFTHVGDNYYTKAYEFVTL